MVIRKITIINNVLFFIIIHKFRLIIIVVKVTANQNGYKKTVYTDNSGIAVFPDLRIGEVVVNVQAVYFDPKTGKDVSIGYTNASFIAQIKAEWEMNDPNYAVPNDFKIPLDGDYYGVLRNAATMIPLFPMQGHTMSTIKGQVTYETDLTNAEPEKAYGVEVVGVIDTDDPDFQAKYLTFGTNAPAVCQVCLSGKIVKIAYGDIVSRGDKNYSPYDNKFSNITGTDGMYELKVPSTADGLPIKIVVSEIARDQYLLMNKKYGEFVNGIQQVRTVFSSEVSALGTINPSPIPAVPAAYVEFSEPKHTTGAQPEVQAVANVVLSESGIEFVHITNQGDGYTQAPIVVIAEAEANGKFNTSAVAVANVVEGKVVSVTVKEPGRGYRNPAAIAVTFLNPEDEALALANANGLVRATATPNVTYSVVNDFNAATAGIPLAGNLVGYTTDPGVWINSDNGGGAVMEAVTLQYVDEVVLLNKGIGYTAAPTVLLYGGDPMYSGNTTVAAVMTASNPIHAINIVTPLNTLFDVVPEVIITDPNGTGAKASVELSKTGGVNAIYITDQGEGYSLVQGEEPTVEITSVDGNGFGASAHAVTTGQANPLGKVLAIVVDYPGEGYTKVPEVRIQAPKKENGRQATAYAGLGRKIQKFNVTDNGSGYANPVVAIKGIVAGNPPTDFTVPGANLAFVYDMSIVNFTFTNKMATSGYTSVPEVVIVAANGQGKNAVAVAKLKRFVTGLKVLAQGSGYNANDVHLRAVVDAPNGGAGIPVVLPRLTANTVLGKGVVESVTILNPGKGYTAVPQVNLLIGGNVQSLYKIKASVRDGSVYKYEVMGGFTLSSPFVNAPGAYTLEVVTRNRTNPASATAQAYPNAGQILAITVTNPGRGYTQAPIVEIVCNTAGGVGGDGNYTGNNGTTLGAGTGAIAHAEIIDGRVSKVVIDNPGQGYYDVNSANPTGITVHFSVPTYNQRAVGIPVISADGRITGVDFGVGDAANPYALSPGGSPLLQYPLTRGMGYDPLNPPSVTFYPAVPGKGANATGTCVVRNGRIDQVVMTNQGGGYLGHNRYVAVCTGRGAASDVFGAGVAAFGIGFQVSPYIGFAYGYPNGVTPSLGGGTTYQGDRFVTEAGKTYIKDIYLGTGKRSNDMQP